MINRVAQCAVLHKRVHNGTSGDTIYQRVTQFLLGYAMLVPGYKFHGWHFESPGYTRTVGGLRGLSYVFLKQDGHEMNDLERRKILEVNEITFFFNN